MRAIETSFVALGRCRRKGRLVSMQQLNSSDRALIVMTRCPERPAAVLQHTVVHETREPLDRPAADVADGEVTQSCIQLLLTGTRQSIAIDLRQVMEESSLVGSCA